MAVATLRDCQTDEEDGAPPPGRSRTLNFLVVGPARGGAGVVQAAAHAHRLAACPPGLFAAADEDRRAAHEAYYGPAADDPPGWFAGPECNLERYLRRVVFDNPQRGEAACGAHLSYDVLARYDLFDLLRELTAEGDFCVVHVVRNPVACYVSRLQAERSGVWRLPAGAEAGPRPNPVVVGAEELTAAVRAHDTCEAKVRAHAADCLTVRYADLLFRPADALARVGKFLDLPGRLPAPPCQRLPNHDMARRFNLPVRSACPSDVRRHFDRELV